MKKIKMILKLIGIIAGSALGIVLIVGLLFVNLSPQFGQGASDEQKVEYAKSGHYETEDGIFVNETPTNMDMNFSTMVKTMREFMKDDPGRQPKKPIQVDKMDSLKIVNVPQNITSITWFGHSAFLIEIEGKIIMIDPMLSDVPAPHPLLGSKRYNEELPLSIDKIPHLDAVILSHDHYDHLDYESIVKLKDRVDHFYSPLGVGNHLVSWGVEQERIHELNWWEEIKHEDLTFVCTPSRHFSGRGLFDRSTTLWGSWVILSKKEKIFFSGDGGYGPHFKEIGEKYGPFDFAMMECGQYNENWSEIHMMPEQTAQATIDVQAKLMMPIHWGAFTLALHDWTDPIERVSVKADQLGVNMTTPRIGEPVVLQNINQPKNKWWENY